MTILRDARVAWRTTVAGASACTLLVACSAKNTLPPDPAPAIAYDVPCDAKAVLETICQQCHSDPPKNGAPFPLVTYENTQDDFKGQKISDQMLYVLQTGKMPLPPVTITQTERDTLLRWLMAGATPVDAGEVCPTGVTPMDAGTDDDVATPDSSGDDGADGDGGDDADSEAGDPPDDANGDDVGEREAAAVIHDASCSREGSTDAAEDVVDIFDVWHPDATDASQDAVAGP